MEPSTNKTKAKALLTLKDLLILGMQHVTQGTARAD